MAVTEALNRDTAILEPPANGCPRCGESWGRLPPITTRLFQGAPLRRCVRCGARFTAGEPPPHRRLHTCDHCAMPFLAGDSGSAQSANCPDCVEGRVPDELTDASVAEATETEILDALKLRGRLVGSPRLTQYLGRILARLEASMPETPRGARVGVFEDDALWTMALPSGTMLLSRGLLSFLKDEAELVFILAHEWTHATTRDAAARLARRGLLALARDIDSDAGGHAAADLLRLGYGRAQERQADLRAVEVMLELRYDPDSIVRFLDRLASRIRRGDPDVAEYSIAHPPPSERLRSIEEFLRGRIESDGQARVNREVFLRAAGPAVLQADLRPVDSIDGHRALKPLQEPRTSFTGSVGWWIFFGLLLLLALLLAR